MKAPQVLRPSRDYLDWFQQESPRSLFALALGLVAISFAPIFIRLSEIEISPYATIFHRSWMAMLIFVGLRGFTGIRSTTSTKGQNSATEKETDWKSTAVLLLLLGSTFTGAVVSWAWALTQTTVANSTLLHSFTPLFTGLFAWIVWGQHFGRVFLIGMAIAAGGALVLGVEEANFNPQHLWGDGMSLVSAVFFSVEPLLVERLRERLGSYTIMAWCCGLIALMTLPILLLFPDRWLPISINGWLSLLGMAIVCQGIGHGLLTYCLKYINAGVVSLSHLSVPIFSAVEAWMLFGEALNWFNALAFAVVLGGIAIGVASPVRQSAATAPD